MKPSLKFNLSEFDKQDRVDVWRSFTSGVYESLPAYNSEGEVTADFSYYRLGGCIFESGAHSGNHIRRKPNAFQQARTEFLVLRMDRSTAVSAIIEDVSYHAMPNDLLLYDYNQNIELSTNTSDFISFRVPYAVIGYDPSKHTRVVHIPGDTSIGRVLRSNLEMLDIIVPKSSEADNTELADGFSALLQTFITRDLIDVRLRERYAASREAAVRRYIKTNLTKNDLGAAAICDAVGVSRAVLYRLFEAEGGVQKAILNMRLTSAFQELTQTEEEWGAIGRIAGKWGFPDQAHFSRRFREVFGIRPSDAIGSSKQVAGLQEATDYKVHSRASKSALLMKLYGASQGRGVLLGGEFGLGTCYKSLA